MTESGTTYQAGDQIAISPDITITLGARRGAHGVRWTWGIPWTDEGGQAYRATPQEAIADAIKTMNTPECAHGQSGWCPDCHDRSNA